MLCLVSASRHSLVDPSGIQVKCSATELILFSFRYIDTMGAQVFVDHMRRFEQSYGVAFTPCQLLQDMAKSGKKFFN